MAHAKATVKIEAGIPAAYVFPTLLAMNTLLLFGLSSEQAIPHWVKLAVSFFLAF
jgi:hypothetical protein